MPLAPETDLLPHQARLADTAEDAAASGDPFRQLAYFKPGTGKTLASIAVADRMRRPYAVMLPAALRQTYLRERGRFAGATPPPVHVMSYSQVGRGAAEDAAPDAVHADEAHRVAGPGVEASRAREALLRARNVLLMTGTPVRNRMEEFGPLLGVLTGAPVTEEDFKRRYVGTRYTYPGGLLGRLRGQTPLEELYVRHRDELADRLRGHVQYHAPHETPAHVTEEVVDTEMTGSQGNLYKAMWGQLPFLLRLKLRMQYPLTSAELRRAQSFLTGPRQISLSDYRYRSDGDPLAAFAGSGKLTRAMAELNKVLDADPRTKGMVYSNFVQSGLVPYAAALRHAGVPHVMFHGGMTAAERRQAVDDFNAGRARVALVGPAGSEGISLRGAQLAQILDEHWHPVRTQQAIHRVLRHDSHDHLPEELRQVKVQRFRATVPPGPIARLFRPLGLRGAYAEPGVDSALANMSTTKEHGTKPLLDLLKEVGASKQSMSPGSVSPSGEEANLTGGRPMAEKTIGPHVVSIDRPRGFRKVFPTPAGPVERTYPVDYGYVKGMVNPDDGEEADVFVGSGGPHHGRFMKGKNLDGGWSPDERKWYHGLTDAELAAVRDLFESQSKGLIRDFTPMTEDAFVRDLTGLVAPNRPSI
jgi:hypothetical protein